MFSFKFLGFLIVFLDFVFGVVSLFIGFINRSVKFSAIRDFQIISFCMERLFGKIERNVNGVLREIRL